MNFDLLLENLTNPALLFYILGLLSVQIKSDLEIPPSTSKFISLYLLFSIGFKGGQELSHSHFSMEILWSVLFGLAVAALIPLYTFFILKRKLNVYDAGAIAAAYGSISAVTFVTAVSFLDLQGMTFSGHMVAIMALMEAPAIIVGVALVNMYDTKAKKEVKMRKLVSHSFANGSVLLILGSLVIGLIVSDQQAEGIKPFTTDIFKGFLAIFLLDMGIVSGQKLADFFKNGWFTLLFAILIPLFNGSVVAVLSSAITTDIGNKFMFAILAASASYIAVPAAMKIANPKSNPSLYLPMALAITFPVNITIGMPLYLYLASLI